MREVFALITFVLLFWIGWDQSFRDHFSNVVAGNSSVFSNRTAVRQNTVSPATMAPSTLGAPKRDNSWMWERSKLDNPHEGKARNVR